MLWIKAFHLVFMVTWFAGLFYLPRLFVYHAAVDDSLSDERFKLMERRLLAIMTIGAALTLLFGLWLLLGWRSDLLNAGWLQAKLALVALLLGYHHLCGRHVVRFRTNRNRHSARYFRWFNEVPGLLLLAIVVLAVVKPG